jgi:hypothetical protein
MLKMSMAGPLGGNARDPGAPTTYVEDVDGGPLGGVAEYSRVPTTYVKDDDGRTPGRRCQIFRSAHHLCQRRRWRGPWEAMPEIRERPPPMSKISIAGPLGGDAGDPVAPSTYVEDVDGEPPGPLGVPVSIHDPQVCCGLHGQHI